VSSMESDNGSNLSKWETSTSEEMEGTMGALVVRTFVQSMDLKNLWALISSKFRRFDESLINLEIKSRASGDRRASSGKTKVFLQLTIFRHVDMGSSA